MQEVKKIGIFTSYSMNPPHPRIEMEFDILNRNGFQTTIVFTTLKKNSVSLLSKLGYYFTFTFFRWDLITLFKSRLKEFDIIIIYDFALLPLVINAKKINSKVIYETIDNNVDLTFYGLTKRFKPFILLKNIIIPAFKILERKWIKKYVDQTLVNSDSLKEALNVPNVRINYYSSPFENKPPLQNQATAFAFLYLGIFTEEKGASQMILLSKNYHLPFYIFGAIPDSSLKKKIKENSLIVHYEKMDIHSLYNELSTLSSQYNFLGFSLIQPVHKSYALQEANKDIDYMALGVPIIGNYRSVTKEKIDAGCGVFFNDDLSLKKMIGDKKFYQERSINALNLYHKKYSIKKFGNVILRAINNN